MYDGKDRKTNFDLCTQKEIKFQIDEASYHLEGLRLALKEASYHYKKSIYHDLLLQEIKEKIK
jgi:hypothetical protein